MQHRTIEIDFADDRESRTYACSRESTQHRWPITVEVSLEGTVLQELNNPEDDLSGRKITVIPTRQVKEVRIIESDPNTHLT